KPNTGGNSVEAKKEESQIATIKTLGLVAPTFISDSFYKKVNIFRYLNYLLGILVLMLVFIPLGRNLKERLEKTEIENEIQSLKKSGFSYHGLYTVLSKLPSDEEEFDIYKKLEQSSLSKEAQEYFKASLESCEKEDFSGINGKQKKKFQNKFFGELAKVVKENGIEKDY
ncbi:MAG: hypothetical protein ACJARO_001670, partial [Bacteriovoracaceae bacterium]